MGLTIFRQHVTNIEQRQFQHVPQILFVFVTVEPSQRSATVYDDIGAIGFCDRIVESLEQRLTIGIG